MERNEKESVSCGRFLIMGKSGDMFAETQISSFEIQKKNVARGSGGDVRCGMRSVHG